jgi:uncharacterized protein (TIGR02646 family)
MIKLQRPPEPEKLAAKKALFAGSHQKCGYCECNTTEGAYTQIDHYKPKSRYPALVFEWENFVPSCAQCNGFKSDHDTGTEPIINPYEINPGEAFYYNRTRIKSKEGGYFNRADKTIEVCSLNRDELLYARARILAKLDKACAAMESALKEYENAGTEKEKQKYRRNIKEALNTAESIQGNTEIYAGFCRYHLNNDDTYNKAKNLDMR